LGFPW